MEAAVAGVGGVVNAVNVIAGEVTPLLAKGRPRDLAFDS
jgi:hypothetical protein